MASSKESKETKAPQATNPSMDFKETFALSKCFCPSYGEVQFSIVKIGNDFKELMKEAEKLSREFIKTFQEKECQDKFRITVGENKMTVSIPDDEGNIPSYDLDQRTVGEIEAGDHVIYEVHLVGQVIEPNLKYNYFHDKDKNDPIMGKERQGDEALDLSENEEEDSEEEEEEEQEEDDEEETTTKKK